MTKAKSILITGASSGIGHATALLASEHFGKVIISARREAKLLKLKDEIQAINPHCEVEILVLDIRNQEDCFKAISTLSSLDVLINNAGLALGKAPFQNSSISHWDTMIDTNVKGLLYMTKACHPLLKQSNAAQVVNICSIAGKETYPNGNVYCATKHAVDSLSKAMRMDFLPDNIRVTNVCPGAVETEFSIVRHEGNKNLADATYDGFIPLLAKDVADAIIYCLNTPTTVNINDIVIMPTAQASATQISRNEN